MAINPNNGVLDIINGTLKVSSIDIKRTGGFTTAINTIARNDVLLYDDQDTNTTFTPTQNAGYSSSSGVTRDTTAIDFNDGWVYWPLQLPNSWHTEFDILIPTTGGVLTYSLFNTSEPNHTDYTANDGGYKIVFDNTQNQIDIRWEGSVHATTSANVRSADWQHVNINYFQGAVSISLAGKVVLTHKFTENYQEFDSRYVGFSATSGASHKIRHLIVHNSDKWLYTKTSNASDISYVSGNVGIGSLSPTELLDVHGNVHIAKDLTVDGNLTVSGTTTFIDTQNLAIEDPIIEVARGNASDTIDAGLVITRASSNVAVAYRGDEEELALGYTQSGASDTDVTPIADGGLDVRVYGNLFANNLTTTANVEATYLKGNGSEITHVTLDQVVDYGNTTANTIHLTNEDVGLKVDGNVEANYFIGNGSLLDGISSTLQEITDNGNVTTNTIQFTNTTTAFIADSNVGIGTDTPSANLHVVGHQYVNDPPTLANSFDHSDAPLTLTHGTPTSTTAIDDPKPVLHLTRDGTSGQAYGARASFNLSRYENSGTASRSRLDVALTDGTYAESNVMSIRADGKVGIGTTAPGYTLDVHGDINLSGDFYQGGSPFVSSLWTDSQDSLYYRSNVEVGTANLFVDTTTSRVGIGTTAPGYTLDVHGSSNVGALTATSISGPLSGNADTATALETARTIGGVSFDGTTNINLPGVNTTGNQDTTGNADTATALETARTINGVSFNGTGNITITANTPNTLTRGSYLTGSNFNGSAATTWAVDATTTNTASKIVARDGNGDIFGRYLRGSYVNMSHGVSTRSTDTVFYSSTDDYIRKTNATGMRASLNVPTRTGGNASGTWGISISGNASTATSVSGGTAVIGTNPAHDDSFDYSDIPLQAHYNSTVTSNTILNDPKSVMMLTREGTTSEAYGAGAAFQLSRWENNGTNSRSRLDIALTDNSFDLTSIMTMRSNGNVGIGVSSPAYKLEVTDHIHVHQSDSGVATLSAYGDSQGTGRLYVGQSSTYGGGIEYNGDNSPTSTGAGADYITLYRVDNGTYNWTARNLYNSNNWEFRGTVTAPTFSGNATTATTLKTARTINGVSFNGSGNITVEPYISNYDTGDTNCPIVFTANSTAGYKRLYEDSTLYFNNTSNILYSPTFSGSLSWNADTATALETARTINGVSFDGSANITVNGLNYNVNNSWLRENGDDANFKQYGSARQMVFRTDGTTEYASGVGGYPFAWMYGGDASSNRRMLLNTSGQLWCSNYGWLHDKFMARAQVFTDNNSDVSFTGQTIDFNGSGSQTNTANRTHKAFFIDYDTSASGGTATANERNYHYAMHSDMRHSGTSQPYAFYNHLLYTRSDHTTGTCSNMRGVGNTVVSSGTGINTAIWGINTYVIKDAGSSGATTTIYGTKTEVEVDAGTVTNAYAYHAHIDRDAGTLTNGYLYYGSYAGTVTTKWGVYITGESKNYFSGNVGIGTTSPGYKLDVSGTLHAGNSYFDNVYIGGSTSRGLRAVSGNYGTVQTTGGGAGNWEGYSIDGRYVFMSENNNSCGIYNDLDNEWMVYCYRNTWVRLYYNGATKLETNNGGITVTGTVTATTFSGNATTATSLSGGTAVIGTNPSHDDNFDYSDIPLQAHYNSTATSNTTLNDPKSVMMLTREGTASEAYGAGAAFQLSRWENNATNSRCRLDIALTDGTFDLTSIMTMRSNGNVGIGETSPSYKLDVNGETRVGNVLYIGKNTDDETAKTIYFGGTSGDNSYNHCVIERRVWSAGTEKQELLLFSGNDGETGSGPDRIRLKGAQILFDTLNDSTDRTTENTKMIIRADGKVGIGTTSPAQKLHVTDHIHVHQADTGVATLSAYGDSQGTGRLYVGQSSAYGGGIEYNGDNSPASTGAGADFITLYRVDNGTYNWTARNLYNSNNWEFRGTVTAPTFSGNATTATAATTATTATNQSGGTVTCTSGT